MAAAHQTTIVFGISDTFLNYKRKNRSWKFHQSCLVICFVLKNCLTDRSDNGDSDASVSAVSAVNAVNAVNANETPEIIYQ